MWIAIGCFCDLGPGPGRLGFGLGEPGWWWGGGPGARPDPVWFPPVLPGLGGGQGPGRTSLISARFTRAWGGTGVAGGWVGGGRGVKVTFDSSTLYWVKVTCYLSTLYRVILVLFSTLYQAKVCFYISTLYRIKLTFYRLTFCRVKVTVEFLTLYRAQVTFAVFCIFNIFDFVP